MAATPPIQPILAQIHPQPSRPTDGVDFYVNIDDASKSTPVAKKTSLETERLKY
jgi:hypothetical protein